MKDEYINLEELEQAAAETRKRERADAFVDELRKSVWICPKDVVKDLDSFSRWSEVDSAHENFIDYYSDHLKQAFLEVLDKDDPESVRQRIELLEKLYQLYKDCGGLHD